MCPLPLVCAFATARGYCRFGVRLMLTLSGSVRQGTAKDRETVLLLLPCWVTMIVLRESDYIAVPWKNGGGVTREIHREPQAPEPFAWRLSLATVDSRGPFSRFDGYERTLVFVRGAGMMLSFTGHGESRLTSAGQMVSFDGSWDTLGSPLDGPCTDLNLMVAKASMEAQARSITLAGAEIISPAGFAETVICCVEGTVDINTAAGKAELCAVDVARCFPSDGAITCRPGKALAAQGGREVGALPRAGAVAARIFVAAIRARS
jgi:uncharacterized protein